MCSVGRLLVALIRLYKRFISPLLGENCRFYPSCSQYAMDAIRAHGAIAGAGYALWRTCHGDARDPQWLFEACAAISGVSLLLAPMLFP